ncbi:hypothetical protein IEO21_10498 [Rhodonia placenta]|uniref:Uncharacterized protein n=1 Tax=Rhodonia placenta TaxID=104341 RepID=A0A8H7NSC0_9APHY|nr:hypothetical protein IEO21_10498 [Postia placenta]
MSSTLSFLDQFNAPSTEGGKRISIYTPKHTHVGDSTLLTLLLSNPTDVFNKLKAHNPEATNATDRAALEAYLSTCRKYDEAVKAADEAIDHHKWLLRQQDNRVLTELIRLDNLKVAHRFQPLLPCSIRPSREALPSRLTGNPTLVGPRREAAGDADRLDTGYGTVLTYGAQDAEEKPLDTWSLKNLRDAWVVIDNVFLEGIINEAKERKEKEKQTKVVPIPRLRSTNPEPPASSIAGPSCPHPNTPVVFRKKHLSGEEWKDVGRNTRNEWFNEEEDNGIDWELYGDGEHLHNGVRAHFILGIVPLRFFLH